MPTTIALIAAMRQESQALLRLVRSARSASLGNLPAWTFSISDRPSVLVTSGMGARRAAQATQLLIERYDPRLIISFGIAGAVDDELDIGDVVLAEAYRQLDDKSEDAVKPLAAWPGTARLVINQALDELGKNLYIGTAITTRGAQVMPAQVVGMDHPILEMETAGIAQVAAQRAIPLYSLRAISDGPRAPIPLDLGEVMDEEANLRVGKMLTILVRQPGILRQALRMMKNTQTAADCAAQALLAALNNWSE